jgi:DNA-binding IclR family transcriptional regulator
MTPLATLRRRQILALLDRQEYATVSEICALTGTSMTTTHRDLAQLARTGALTRIHGGAARPAAGLLGEPRQLVEWLARVHEALDRDDFPAVEGGLQQALALCRRLCR